MPIQYASIDEANQLVTSLGGDGDSIVHLGNFGNSVFRFSDWHGFTRILRFTDRGHRQAREIEGELDYLLHLHAQLVPCHCPIAFPGGKFTYVSPRNEVMIATLFTVAPGIYVDETLPYWGRDIFQEWGKNLGLIHQALKSFKPQLKQRWIWSEESLIGDADKLIPKDDLESHREFNAVVNACLALKVKQDNFGMIHADHAPQNFNFDPMTKNITAFDFANCCYH